MWLHALYDIGMSSNVRLNKVISFIKLSGVSSGWARGIKTEKDALRLIDEVIEGDFDPENQFDEAFEQFKKYFKSYAIYCAELNEERDLGSPYEF